MHKYREKRQLKTTPQQKQKTVPFLVPPTPPLETDVTSKVAPARKPKSWKSHSSMNSETSKFKVYEM